MAKSFAELQVKIAAKVQGFDKATKTINSRMRSISRNVTSFGDTITRSIGLPFIAALGAGAKLTTELEGNFTKIKDLVGVAGDEINFFKDGVRSLSGEVGTAQTELSRALFTITSAGVKGSEALDILETSAKASAVGLGDTQEIARATTAVLQAYGSENITASEASEILFKTVREGNLEASELAPALGRVIPIASKMGVSFAEVGANVATFTRLGVSSEEAITGLKSSLVAFLNPTRQAREELAKYGISADDVRKSIQENGLARTLVSLNEKLDGNFDSLGKVIPNVRALSNIMGVAGKQSAEYIRISEDLTRTTNFQDEAFKNVTETAGFKFKKALNDLKNVSIELGAIVIPIIVKIAETVSSLANRFNSLSPGIKNTLVNVGLLVTSLGLFASVGGRVIGNAAIMIKTFRNLRSTLFLVEASQWKLNAAMTANPIGAIIAGLSLLVGGFVLAYKKSEKFRAFLHGLGGVAKEVFLIIKESIGGFIDGINSISEGETLKGLKQIGNAITRDNPVVVAFTQGERLGGAFIKGMASQLSEKVEEEVIKAVDIDPSNLPVIDIPVDPIFTGGSTSGPDPGETSGTPEDSELVKRLDVETEALSKHQIKLFDTSNVYADAMSRMSNAGANASESIKASMTAITIATANNVANTLQGFGAIINGIAGIAGKSKGFALLEIAVNSAIGVSRAIASGAGLQFPANLAAIATGVSTVLSGIGQAKAVLSGATAFADGGIVYGPTLGLVGEYSGARSNPEVIAPLNKLRDMINPANEVSGNMNLSGRLIGRGSDLVAVLDYAKAEQNRYR